MNEAGIAAAKEAKAKIDAMEARANELRKDRSRADKEVRRLEQEIRSLKNSVVSSLLGG